MAEWLRERLTPVKKKIARWTDLAEILEQLWEEFYDPELSRTQRMRSSYTADDRDLVKKIREMGDYFSFEFPKQADRPIALAWRRLEIEYKDVEKILQSVLRRHFGDFPVRWYPLFAPTNEPYGSRYLISDYLAEDEYTKNIPPEGYFLTSRGYLGVDKLGLMRDRLTKKIFREEATPLVRRTKPLHIIFEGILWYLRYDLGIFDPEINALWGADGFHELRFGPLGSRYDYLAADARHVDIDVFDVKSDTERQLSFPFFDYSTHPWRLDLYLRDGFGDILPVDVTLPGRHESLSLLPFSLLFCEALRTIPFRAASVDGEIERTEIERQWGIVKAKLEIESLRVQSRDFRVYFNAVRRWGLDDFCHDGFGDMLPVDIMRREQTAQSVLDPFSLPYGERDNTISLRIESAVGEIERTEIERQWGIVKARLEIESLRVQSRDFRVYFNAVRRWGLDDFCHDGFGDMLPVDIMRREQTAQSVLDPFSLPYGERDNTVPIEAQTKIAILRAEKTANTEIVMVDGGMPQLKCTDREKTERSLFFGEDEIALDRIPQFDAMTGDFAPLDYPYGGFV